VSVLESAKPTTETQRHGEKQDLMILFFSVTLCLRGENGVELPDERI